MQKHVPIVLILLVSITLPMVGTPAWAAGGHVATFARTYSGPTASFFASSVKQTTDGGFIVAGLTSSSIGAETWLLRLDATGTIVWERGYAGTICNVCFFPSLLFGLPHAVQTPDGGFVVESTTNISSTISPISIAAMVFKVDTAGSLVWQRAFTGTGNATGESIDTTSDGGIVVAGITGTAVGNPVPGATSVALVLKLDSMGDLLWEKTYSGLGASEADFVGHTSDGGFVVAGGTFGSLFGGQSPWVLRLNSDGSILWQNVYVENSVFFSVEQTSDGGFIAAGQRAPTASTPQGLLVLRLDSTGAPVWEKIFGGAVALAFSIQQTFDGGFVVAGTTGFGTSSPSALVLKLDGSGNIVWQRAFGASIAFSIQQTSDGGFVVAGIVAGSAPSTFGALVFKLNSMGEIHPCKDLSNTSLAAATLSAPATSITGGSPVDITSTSPGITTTFTSTNSSASSMVLCR